MPENVLNRSQRNPLSKHQAGGAIAEIVEANIGQFGLGEDPLEIIVQTVWLERRSYPRVERFEGKMAVP